MIKTGVCGYNRLNYSLAKRWAEKFYRKYGEGISIAAEVDVVTGIRPCMIKQTVDAYGGLDIFVSNPGVLKAGGLEKWT